MKQIFDLFRFGYVEFLNARRSGLLEELPETVEHVLLTLIVICGHVRIEALPQQLSDVLGHHLGRGSFASLGLRHGSRAKQ